MKLASLLLVAALGSTAAASPDHVDVEIDPTAYALSGNSIHVGIGFSHLRVDLGNFGLALPQLTHGDDGFDVRFDGYGAKLHYYLRTEQTGLFVGVGASFARVRVHLQGSDLAGSDDQLGTGVEVGYRIPVVDHFYVTPWIGVGYDVGADKVTLGGKTYDPNPVTIFPAIHLGYQFR